MGEEAELTTRSMSIPSPLPTQQRQAQQLAGQGLQPKAITAVLLGLKSKVATFAVQRQVNEYRGEPLLAILPGVALQELWSLMGTAEKALFVVSLFVVLTGLIGMLTAILTSLNERRREMAILRSVGARPWHIAGLLVLEALTLALAGRGAGPGPAVRRHRRQPGLGAGAVRPVSAAGIAQRL